MSEIDQLKIRIDNAGPAGVLTAHVREDYEPAGDMMMHVLMKSGEYVQRKDCYEWKIYKKGMEPY